MTSSAAQFAVISPHFTAYDTAVVGSYVVFMLGLGVVFRGLSKNTSDYFRCGGAMPWWITGTSAWLSIFSAWAFVGAASDVFREGTHVMLVFYATIPAMIAVAIHTCVRFRRLRVITWTEAVRERFGPISEQFYTWIRIPIELAKAAFTLMAISVFAAAVLDVPVKPVIATLGVTFTLVTFAGGAFAVVASDFVQLLLVMTITLVTVVLTLRQPEIGGLAGLIDKVGRAHPAHLEPWVAMRPFVLLAYAAAFVSVKFVELNSIEFSTPFLMPKNEQHARRMVWIPLVGGLIGPVLWIIPPLAATIFYPDLATVFPQLAKPTEGAFVATAMRVLPVGLLGLLISAMFGATITNLDHAVNKYVGVFVRSLYRPVWRPDASERHLLIVSKLGTLVFGLLIIALAVVINTRRTSDLFTLLNQFMVSLALPLTIPVFIGLFVKRTPPWSAWVAGLAGFGYSAWANFIFARQVTAPEFLAHLPAIARWWLGRPTVPLTHSEANDLLLAVTVFGTLAVGAAVFFGSMPFFASSSAEHRRRVEAMFIKLRTPLEAQTSAERLSDEPVYRLLGRLCLGYGGLILALMAIPSGATGRLCFLFVGGSIAGAGVILHLVARRKRRAARTFDSGGEWGKMDQCR